MAGTNGVLNHYDHSGHVAVVTGGTKGIGRAIAESLLAGGARVVLAGRASATGEAVLHELDANGSAHFIATDVTSQSDCEGLIDQAVERFGYIDILVNNAGGVGQFLPVAQMTDEEWNRTIALNLGSTFWCTRRAIPHMIERGWGRILNISSMEALEPLPAFSHYGSAKRAVHAFTRAVCKEVGSFGVTANVICPGLVITDMVRAQVPDAAAANGITEEQFYDMMRQRAPIGRLVTAEEIAAYAGFLFTDAGAAVTGQVLSVDGGTAEH
jgi:3-hydroxybutyrate dehydrogenase/3-oxoacyl-[acyl-carrier protein] reductase